MWCDEFHKLFLTVICLSIQVELWVCQQARNQKSITEMQYGQVFENINSAPQSLVSFRFIYPIQLYILRVSVCNSVDHNDNRRGRFHWKIA